MDNDSLEKICNSFAENKIVGFVKVFDEDDNLLFAIDTDRGSQFIQGNVVIQHKNKKIGQVVVGLSSVVYEEKNKELLFGSIFMTLIAIAGIAVAAKIFFQLLLKAPIDDLICRIDSIAVGDYNYFSNSQVHKYKEVGAILSKFNEMAILVKKRESSLTEAKKKLENEVSDRKEAELELLKWSHVFKNASWGIAAYGVGDNTLELINPAYARMHGYSVSELMGENVSTVFRTQFHSRLFDIIEKSLKKENCTFEADHLRKDGSVFPVSHDITIVKNSKKEPIYSIVNIKDLTSRKEAEKERQLIEEKLKQSQKMESIGTLAGGIAHDFNNILTSVLGFSELALGAVEKATPIEEDLQEIYKAGIRAKDLVKQILTFASQPDEELKPIQVHFVIKEVLKFIRASTPTTIEIKQNIVSEALIMGSSTQIHRVMMNLCTNAAHAMEDKGGTLELTLKDITIDKATLREKWDLELGNYIEIKVSDTGIGIDRQIMDQIFEPYFTTKGLGEGTGMGLAMVHGIVDTYGGKIFVESSLGQGTVVTIYLPAIKGSWEHPRYKAEDFPMGRERILFVDDEASIVKIGTRLLSQLGYSVTARTSSVEALELFRSKPDDFDLVISDVTMPKMTGDQLSKDLMVIRPDIPIILYTGYNKRLSEKAASEIGIKAFVCKPIVKEDLAKVVRDVLDEANILTSTETS